MHHHRARRGINPAGETETFFLQRVGQRQGVEVCEAIAKCPPERRTEILLRIAVEPLQPGRRVVAPFVFWKRCCGEFHLRHVAADFNFGLV
jgi:hypothetical protein